MRLKILLQSNFLISILIIFLSIFIIIKTKIITYSSVYSGSETSLTGVIKDYEVSDGKLTINLLAEEEIIVYYYFYEDFNETDLYGKNITITGELYEATGSTLLNTFDYKKYLYNNKIYYLFKATDIEFLDSSFNIKNVIENRINNLSSKDYLLLFILGDKSGLSSEVYSIYQSNGIAHLLAISGLHINLFILLLEKLLSKFSIKKKNFFILSFLFIYSYITSFTVSVLRCVIFFILSLVNNFKDWNISKVKILLYTAFILLLYNPFYIYNIGFLYSFVITYFLLILKPLKKDSYLKSSFRISFISFLACLPITASMNYEVNLTSILFNLVFVPFVSFIIFPLSLLTFCFPFLDSVFNFFIVILEYMNSFCSMYLSLIINIPNMNYICIFLYYLSLLLSITFKKRYYIFLLIILFINKVSYKLDSSYYIYYVDIGQGDCNILISPYQSEVLMIDTGGNYYYSVSDNVILFLKSIGITKIDLLVISHGDSDHALETENIYNNLLIESIMFNNNEYNDLEQSILLLNIPIVNEVDLKYFSANNINENIDNENDASIVLYFNIYDYRFLYTGDIGTDALEYLVSIYNLECDFYKVAHHGSINNTSDYIINKINPTYAFISAGKNNIYNHPSEEVIEILDKYEVITYQTLINGSICVKVSKDSYHIYSFSS